MRGGSWRLADAFDVRPSDSNAASCRFDINDDPPRRLCLISLCAAKKVDEEQRECSRDQRSQYEHCDHILIYCLAR